MRGGMGRHLENVNVVTTNNEFHQNFPINFNPRYRLLTPK